MTIGLDKWRKLDILLTYKDHGYIIVEVSNHVAQSSKKQVRWSTKSLKEDLKTTMAKSLVILGIFIFALSLQGNYNPFSWLHIIHKLSHIRRFIQNIKSLINTMHPCKMLALLSHITRNPCPFDSLECL